MPDYPNLETIHRIHNCSIMKSAKTKWLASLLVTSLLQGAEPLEYYRTPGLGVSWRKIDLRESEYDGKKIIMNGWLGVTESEASPVLTLYESREALETGDLSKSISVLGFGEWCTLTEFPEGFRGLLSGHFATIIGVFEVDVSGNSLGNLKKLDSVHVTSTSSSLIYSPYFKLNPDKDWPGKVQEKE